MTATSDERRQLERTAWCLATDVLPPDAFGKDSPELSADDRRRFLRRKACRPFPKDTCLQVLDEAVAVARSTKDYIRSSVGCSQPGAVAWHELLLGLARHLRSEHPDAPESLLLDACALLEARWMR